MKPVINKRKCPAEKDICMVIPSPQNNAVSYQSDPKESLGGKIVIDMQRCNDCGICVTTCCGQAIELV